MALVSTRALTKMSSRIHPWAVRRPVSRADNFTTFICRLSSNYGNLKLLEPQGPVQTCYGMAWPISFWSGSADRHLTIELVCRNWEEAVANQMVTIGHMMELRKTMETEDSRCLGRDLNRTPPDYKTNINSSVAPCSLVAGYQHFWGTYCLYLQNRKTAILP